LVLNTPHDADLGEAINRHLDALVVEAERYIEGKRAQGNLFEGAPPRGGVVDTLMDGFDPDTGEVTESPVQDAARRFAAAQPKGVTMTISSGGRSATITPQTGENARKALREMRKAKARRTAAPA
jgi:hypothetical protein